MHSVVCTTLLVVITSVKASTRYSEVHMVSKKYFDGQCVNLFLTRFMRSHIILLYQLEQFMKRFGMAIITFDSQVHVSQVQSQVQALHLPAPASPQQKKKMT